MPLDLSRIEWMPSPPLAPQADPIDVVHLARMTLGDARLEHQVLGLFSAQTLRLINALEGLQGDASSLAHTLKGSARAIGAFRLAEAAERLEAAVKNGRDVAEALADLTDAAAQAQAAIAAILRQS